MKDLGEVHAQALRFLARREYGEQEMVQKLVGKGAGRALAVQVVEQLRGNGSISDERFANALTAARVRQGYGPRRIENELLQRGVPEPIVSTNLTEMDVDWNARLLDIIRRKYQDRPPLSYNEWAKRANFLKTRGFTAEQIRGTLGRYQQTGGLESSDA